MTIKKNLSLAKIKKGLISCCLSCAG